MKKKTKEKDLTGTTITFSKLQTNFLNNAVNRRLQGEELQTYGARVVIEARKRLWETILDFAPEAKGYHSMYNNETGVLTILSKEQERKKDEPKL